ncbi:MAG: hypothetical protein JWO95_783 [Verrucomicrobiales bacterium]|nr:hypothetical protein [Verrucomicrobiales bacterium]
MLHKQFFTHVIAFALVVVTAACSKNTGKQTPEETKMRRELSIPAEMPLKKLGLVELLENTPKSLDLGVGKICTVTATQLPNGRLQLVLVSKSNIVNVVNGVRRFEETFTTESSRAVIHLFDGMLISFTPVLKTN